MLSGIMQLTLAGLALFTLAFSIPGFLLYRSWRRRQNEQRLQATGEPAMARILSVRETGHIVNRRHEARIVVEVTHPARGTWPASLRRVMSIEDIQFFVPGRIFEVRFDPADPGTVAPAP